MSDLGGRDPVGEKNGRGQTGGRREGLDGGYLPLTGPTFRGLRL